MTNNGILNLIAAARGNRSELLALASSDNLDLVAYAKGVTPIYAAKFVAQRLFDAPTITIKWKGQPGSRTSKRCYDLTDANQAYDALAIWGIRSEALQMWQQAGSHEAFVQAATSDPTINQNNITTELKIQRHK